MQWQSFVELFCINYVHNILCPNWCYMMCKCCRFLPLTHLSTLNKSKHKCMFLACFSFMLLLYPHVPPKNLSSSCQSVTNLHLSHIVLDCDINAALVRLLWAVLWSFFTLPGCLWLLAGAILTVFATSCYSQLCYSPTHLQSVAPHCRSPQCHLPIPSAGPPEPRLPPHKPKPFLSGFQSLQTRGHNLKIKAQKIWSCGSCSQHLLFLLTVHIHLPHIAVIVEEKDNSCTSFGCCFNHTTICIKAVRWQS